MRLLEEQNLSFAFCLNKNNIITLCGLSLLYQDLELVQDSNLMNDGQRLASIAIDLLEKANAPSALDLKRLAACVMTSDSSQSPSRRSADGPIPAASTSNSTPS